MSAYLCVDASLVVLCLRCRPSQVGFDVGRLVADILQKENYSIMEVNGRSAHDIAENLVKPIDFQTSEYRQHTQPVFISCHLNFLDIAQSRCSGNASFNLKKKLLSENTGKMKITSRPCLNYPQACFSNDIVTRFDLMRISVDLGNKQQQVDTVDICKRKSKTIMEITMLTSLSITRPCVCIGTACIA